MNAKRWWAGWSTAVLLVVLNGNLPAQEEQKEELKTQDLRPDETEETILKEKVEGLEKAYEILQQAAQGGLVDLKDLFDTGCELSLAKAEHAACQGKSEQQVKHLKEALHFAELHVEVVQGALVRPVPPGIGAAGGFGPSPGFAKAFKQRADVKLTLLRAKQKQDAR